MSNDYASRLRIDLRSSWLSLAVLIGFGIVLATSTADARSVDCNDPANAHDPICQPKRSVTPARPSPVGSKPKALEEVCLGAIPACEKYKSLREAVDAIDSMGRKQPTLKVYPGVQSIPSGGAVIKFSLDLIQGDGAADTPVIAGECVEVVAINSAVRFGVDGVEMRTCLRVHAADSVTLQNTTFGPSSVASRYPAAITLSNVKRAVVDNVQIDGHSVGLAVQGTSVDILGGSEIRRADVGLLVRTSKLGGKTLNVRSLKIARNDQRGRGVVVESDVRDTIVIEGAELYGLEYGIDAQSPVRMQNSSLIKNRTAVRLGEASSFYRINSLPYVFSGIALDQNALELQLAASLPNLIFNTASWSIDELQKRVVAEQGAKIEYCDDTLKAIFSKFDAVCSKQRTVRK